MHKRIIPVLLLDRDQRLVKTVRFGERTYLGDPFNVVRLFNEKEVDEVCVLDIDATVDGRPPDFGYLRELAGECFMPIAYGGGIAEVAHCERLNRDGIEKFVLGHGALQTDLVRHLCRHFGSQAVVTCVDVRGEGPKARCVTKNGRLRTTYSPVAFCQVLQDCGVGEIIIQAVDRDGLRTGYDLDLIQRVSSCTTVPVVALGGAGDSREHLKQALNAGASAAASGSAFVFIGRLRAVLVTYPDNTEVERIAGIAA